MFKLRLYRYKWLVESRFIFFSKRNEKNISTIYLRELPCLKETSSAVSHACGLRWGDQQGS